MIVAGHQPDLLPYSGFWYKVARSDVFDLKLHDQYLRKGYQRRTLFRGEWATIPVGSCPQDTPISEVRMDPVKGPETLVGFLRGRYSGARYYKLRGKELEDRILSVHSDRLWHLNFELLLAVKEMLGIDTPFAIAPKPTKTKSAAIIQNLQRYHATVYLSGPGGQKYMGDCAEFTEAGIRVEWSRHRPVTGDSIVTVLMDYGDPLSIVMAEQEGTQA